VASEGSVTVHIRVRPGAGRDRIEGWRGEALRVSVGAPPERGKANRAVEKLLAKALGLPVSAVAVVRGASSRDKVVEVQGLGADEVRGRLLGNLHPD
jgi:hypothetical protein